MRARRGLRFTLCVLFSASAIIGMMPITQALAASSEFANDFDSSTDILASDGLISRLLGGDDDEDDDDDDDDEHDDEDDEDGDDDDKGGGDDDKDEDSEKDRPRAHDQSVDVEEDSSIRIELEASADRDDQITFAIVEEPENGKLLEFDASGIVTYEPAANFYGSDSFAFKASDGDEESQPAIVTIDIRSLNDLPVAVAASIATTEGRAVSFELGGTDIETEDLEFVILADPSHGKLQGTAPNLTYSPDNHFDGTDELTFKVSDGTGDSEPAAVKIKVRERDRDRDESEKWWEKPPVTPKPSEPVPAPTMVNNTTEAAPEPAEPEQVTVVAQPIPAIAQSPVVSAALVPVDIAEAPRPDLVAPQLILPGSLLNVIATSREGAIVDYDAKAIDDIDGELQASCSPASGSIVPVGTFNVVCAATDAAGNSALKSFTVAVSAPIAGNNVNHSISFLASGVLAAVVGVGGYFGFRTLRRHKPHD